MMMMINNHNPTG